MQYEVLGNTGLEVSRLCLGCMTYGSPTWQPWVLPWEQSLPSIRRAWEAGINFFDTADVYSLGASEEMLAAAFAELGVARESVVIATKVFFPMGDDRNAQGLSKKHIRHAVDESLRRLNTDYIDLYQIHRLDRRLPMEAILEALGELVAEGKVLHLGASSMYAWEFAKMLFLADQLGVPRFVSMQNHYNLIYREEEREMIPLCRDQNIALIPWSPLARGFLAGNRTAEDRGGETARAQSDNFAKGNYFTPADFEVAARVGEVAKERGVPPSQIALAWVLSRPGITSPIVGTSKPHHLDDALAALELTLSDDEVARLEEPYQPHPVLGHSYAHAVLPMAPKKS